MRNNIIAIIAISFVTVGAMWGLGNLLNPPRESDVSGVEGILLVAQNNAFNGTNPDIYVEVNVPKKLVVLNKDFVRHDLIVEELNINTAYLRAEQQFTTAIVAQEPGVYEYYCSLHQIDMRGRIIAQ